VFTDAGRGGTGGGTGGGNGGGVTGEDVGGPVGFGVISAERKGLREETRTTAILVVCVHHEFRVQC
jgi:hypothetical protein